MDNTDKQIILVKYIRWQHRISELCEHTSLADCVQHPQITLWKQM